MRVYARFTRFNEELKMKNEEFARGVGRGFYRILHS